MELIERDTFLTFLQTAFEKVNNGEGHCVFINGEAGIGKTSLVKTYCSKIKDRCNIYRGTCDALFAPRPLAPVYDVLLQLRNEIFEGTRIIEDRVAFFTQFFYELKKTEKTCVLIFEDIHWADEATLDFIKFLARRITQLPCLFILTYRDNEIHLRHPLRHVLGQLNPDSFSRMQLPPLSKESVEMMSAAKGYKGEDVFNISGGNPFYVNEILASYNLGVPDNIKDSILSFYNRLDEDTKYIWQILSVLPTGFEIKYLEKIEPSYSTSFDNCLDLKILISKDGSIFFKHQLFARTIEASLSPLLRIELNKKILHLFKDSFEKDGQIERIIHHAKAANAYEVVVHYAPLAAVEAAKVGAHIQASRLYLTAIEYYQGQDKETLLQLYEQYSYECYLSNQIKEAIIYSTKSIELLTGENDIERKGNCLRLLSILWCNDGNMKKGESYALDAIDLLKDQPSSLAKAMTFTNMSHLKMISYEVEECIHWSEKAIEIAKELGDDKVLCHAMNNMGTVLSRIGSTRKKGIALQSQSLEIAQNNSYQEHVIRAYASMGGSALVMKDYALAKGILEAGIKYGEERDLGSWTSFILSEMARLHLEMGQWSEAFRIADNLLNDERQTILSKSEALAVLIKIKLRRGENLVLPLLLEAKKIAFEVRELQILIPSLTALLEYEWLTGKVFIEKEIIDAAINMIRRKGNIFENSEFAFWMWKARSERIPMNEFYEGYRADDVLTATTSASLWKALGCPYEQALLLFEGTDEDKRKALEIVDKLGATAVFEKMKFLMKTLGIKQLPKGIRKTTKANSANLTQREIEVLQLLKEGLQNKEIADSLFISVKTVDHHLTSIFFKLNVNSRTKAIQEAHHLDILK